MAHVLHRAGQETEMHKDPVCGMQVDPANAAGRSEHNRQTYYFCSKSCQKQFEANPAKFVQ